jgi:hypothetical protein
LKNRGFRASMTPGGLHAEEQIQRESNHYDLESG